MLIATKKTIKQTTTVTTTTTKKPQGFQGAQASLQMVGEVSLY